MRSRSVAEQCLQAVHKVREGALISGLKGSLPFADVCPPTRGNLSSRHARVGRRLKRSWMKTCDFSDLSFC